MKHPLVNRTSPKGKPFEGTCAACGKTHISLAAAQSEDCENPRNMTYEEAFLEAVCNG